MVFLNKNNLGKFWKVLQKKMLVYIVAIWYILCQFGIFPLFGKLYEEKCGNPIEPGERQSLS
jgi:hypothetical protein